MFFLCRLVLFVLVSTQSGIAMEEPQIAYDDSCISRSFEGIVVKREALTEVLECQASIPEPSFQKNQGYILVSSRSKLSKEAKPGDSCEYVTTFCEESR